MEAKRLAVGDGDLAMFRIATFHVEVLVLVCGFGLQVALDPALFLGKPLCLNTCRWLLQLTKKQ